jgi:hypothetical protein
LHDRNQFSDQRSLLGNPAYEENTVQVSVKL